MLSVNNIIVIFTKSGCWYRLALCLADVRDYASYPGVVEWVGSHLEGEGLNVLVNNAGIAHWQGLEDVTREHIMDCLETNAVVPVMIAKVTYTLR